MCQDVTPLQIVYPDTALRLQALLDFEEDHGEKKVAGDEWLFEGPGKFMFRHGRQIFPSVKAAVLNIL